MLGYRLDQGGYSLGKVLLTRRMFVYLGEDAETKAYDRPKQIEKAG